MFLGTGYDFHYGKFTTGPTGTLHYSKLWIDGFTESGADSLNLCISDQRTESVQLGFGWRVEYELKARGKVLRPNVKVSYQHEFADDSRYIEAHLEDGNNIFQVATDKPSRDFALVGVGITVELTDSVSFSSGYDAQLGKNEYIAQSIYGNLRFNF